MNRCMNCGNPASELFEGVMVCPACRGAAQELCARAESDTRRLLLLVREGIRVALIEKRFAPAADTPGALRDALKAITTLKDAAERRRRDHAT